MKEITLEYIAGLFDGEGCVSITKRSESDFYIRCCIVNAHRQVLLDVINFFALGVIHNNVNKIKPNRKIPVYTITFDRLSGVAFMEAIKPYLRIKIKEVEHVLQYHSEKIKLGGKKQNLAEKAKLGTKYKTELMEMRYRGYSK